MKHISLVLAAVVGATGLYLMTAPQLASSPGAPLLPAARVASTSSTPGGLRRAAGTAPGPVVVELFTSQGCSSCPPADRYLGKLAGRDDVVALSWHVDYWDYIGWKDKFATKDTTRRQRDYGRALRQRYVYTPELVVDGRAHSSSPAKISQLIESARATPKLQLAFDQEGGKHTLRIPAADFKGEANVLVVFYDTRHVTDIKRGENGGRSLEYHNVVREFRVVGRYTGEAMAIPVETSAAEAAGRGGCVVIVQEGSAGPVLGALKMPFANGDG